MAKDHADILASLIAQHGGFPRLLEEQEIRPDLMALSLKVICEWGRDSCCRWQSEIQENAGNQ